MGARMGLKVRSEMKSEGVFTIFLWGSLDTDTCPVFEKTVDDLLEKSPTMIVFDMRQVEYIGSVGIRVLLKARRELKKTGNTISLVNLQPSIRKVFDIVNDNSSLRLFATETELDCYLTSLQEKHREGL
jgi:anti-sigma B factor antagonist